jgi:Mrp family chromosome partitioning ATPase
MLKSFRAASRSESYLRRCFRSCLQLPQLTRIAAPKLLPEVPKRSLQTLSKRQLASLEDHVHSSVTSTVKDPILDRDLASLGWLHRKVAVSDDNSTWHLLLRLPTLLHPELALLKDDVKREATKAIAEWKETQGLQQPLPNVNVEAIATTPWSMMAQLVDDTDELFDNLGPGLANVAHFVAVYSAKGGVGKSTVAVNLAYELAAMGGRVGLVDLDVYGPSLPVLVQPLDVTIRSSPLGKGFVYPIQHQNVKLLSLGYVNTDSGVPGSGQRNGASIMRGPMAGKVVTQLLKGTDWGELDVLVLDLPPGTGDVQLQVLQELQISGSVAVTTPSKLAALDTKKGIEMFTSLGVPTIAIVENMAYFECEGGGVHYPFGRGIGNSGTLDFKDVATIVQLPISEQTNAANDEGEPFCLVRSDQSKRELSAFNKLANALSSELLKMQYNMSESHVTATFPESKDKFDVATVHLSLDKVSETFTVRIFSESGAIQQKFKGFCLRARDPKSGLVLEESPYKEMANTQFDQEMVVKSNAKKTPALIPTSVQRRGRYGYGVQWADGATIIYSMRSLAAAAGGKVVEDNGAY